MMKWTTTAAATLLDQLAHLAPQSSKTRRREWICEGRTLVNGKIVKIPSTWIEADSHIVIDSPAKKIIHPQGVIPILFEDDYLIVLEKPAGLLSVDKDEKPELSLHEIIKARSPKRQAAYPYHRLDKGTSGIILFCKNKESLAVMQEARSDTVRLYEALVEGIPKEEKGCWDSHLKEISPQKVITCASSDGLRCITDYEVIDFDTKTARLQLKLHSGRRHQIRVQAAHAGHPIIGDKLYGAKNDFLGRIALHARYLEITHPVTGKRLEFRSQVPF